jgi:Cu2+-exporting ATPase
MLPEDKRSLVRELKAAGHVVAVIGDGVNDSWALSEADVGVSLSQAADVAREVCDVLLTGHDLRALPVAIDISRAALARISLNFRLIVGLNSGLLLMGLLGLLRPAASALLHNLGTVLAALNAVRPLALPAPRACTPTEDTP